MRRGTAPLSRWLSYNSRRVLLAVSAVLYLLTVLAAPWLAKGSPRVLQLLASNDVPLARYAPLFAPPDCVAVSGGLACRYELNLPLLLSEWLIIGIAAVIAWLWTKGEDVPVLLDRAALRERTQPTSLHDSSSNSASDVRSSSPKEGRNSDQVQSPNSAAGTQTKPPWYQSTRNLIGLVVLSIPIYGSVLIAVMAGAYLKGNEAIYITAWTAFLFYFTWKRRKWKGWIGTGIGLVCGVAIVFFATALTGFLRAS